MRTLARFTLATCACLPVVVLVFQARRPLAPLSSAPGRTASSGAAIIPTGDLTGDAAGAGERPGAGTWTSPHRGAHHRRRPCRSAAPPVAKLTACPREGTAPLRVRFDGSRSFDRDGVIATYRFDFGDGTAPVAGNRPTARHCFQRPGTYRVVLTVRDDDGLSGRACVVVVVRTGDAPTAPVARLVASPLQGEAPRTVDFDGSASADRDGEVVSFRYDFGDGSAPVTSSGPAASHRFEAPGTYTAALTVTDDDGLSDRVTLDVLVTPNPLRNGDFEEGANGAPAFWTPQAFTGGSSFLWGDGLGRSGTRGVQIVSPTPNDAFWQQAVSLTPDVPYNLRATLRGLEIAGGGAGANVCLVGPFVRSDSLLGAFPFQSADATFLSPPDGQVTVGVRLGFFGSTVTGTLWADDAQLSSDDFAPRIDGEHVRLWLERQDLSAITPASLAAWVETLDAFYRVLGELVGSTPFAGAPIAILSVRQFPGGLAVAGNPISWQQRFVRDQLLRTNDQGDASFALTHELSHDFDLDGRWVFDAEFSSALKQFRAVEVLDALVVESGVPYRGSGLVALYQRAYDDAVAAGTFTWGAMTYRFILVAQAIGWRAFKSTYRDFSALQPGDVPTTGLDKLNLFLDRLSAHAGLDVRTMIPPSELTWLQDNAH